jgi:UDP-glucose 4-epimerase
VAATYADSSKAKRDLEWEAVRSLDEMCEDVWRWQSQNPQGYEGA